jgi:hypothetical protein
MRRGSVPCATCAILTIDAWVSKGLNEDLVMNYDSVFVMLCGSWRFGPLLGRDVVL